MKFNYCYKNWRIMNEREEKIMDDDDNDSIITKNNFLSRSFVH